MLGAAHIDRSLAQSATITRTSSGDMSTLGNDPFRSATTAKSKPSGAPRYSCRRATRVLPNSTGSPSRSARYTYPPIGDPWPASLTASPTTASQQNRRRSSTSGVSACILREPPMARGEPDELEDAILARGADRSSDDLVAELDAVAAAVHHRAANSRSRSPASPTRFDR